MPVGLDSKENLRLKEDDIIRTWDGLNQTRTPSKLNFLFDACTATSFQSLLKIRLKIKMQGHLGNFDCINKKRF